jgi:hypothetical protein
VPPPANTALIDNVRVIGTDLRVQATAMAGLTVRAASMISRTAVATPADHSISVWDTFQPA